MTAPAPTPAPTEPMRPAPWPYPTGHTTVIDGVVIDIPVPPADDADNANEGDKQ